jgi:hypothetical protein
LYVCEKKGAENRTGREMPETVVDEKQSWRACGGGGAMGRE